MTGFNFNSPTTRLATQVTAEEQAVLTKHGLELHDHEGMARVIADLRYQLKMVESALVTQTTYPDPE